MVNDQMQQQAAKQPAQAAPKGVPVSPKVAQVFQRLLMAAMKLIYSAPQDMVQAMQSAQDPIEGIVNTAKTVVGQVAEKAKGINPEVVQRIGVPVAALLAELATKAGLVEDSPELMQKVVAALNGGGQEAPAEEQQEQPPEQPQPPQPPQGLVASEMGAQ